MKLHVIFILFFITSLAMGQGKYNANWVFGVNAGINFSDTAHPSNYFTLSNNFHCSASVSDSAGNLLLYIAPDTPFNMQSVLYRTNAIFGSNNKIIAHGDSLITDDWIDQALFIPRPHTNNDFLVFYSNQKVFSNGVDVFAYNQLCYGEIIKDSAGFHMISKNQQLLGYPVERGMVAIKHANGSDWWLLVHKTDRQMASNATDHYYTFLIKSDTILGPFEQRIGSLHQGNYPFFSSDFTYFAKLSASPNGNWVACALDDQPNSDLFNFDRCTGKLFNYISLNLSYQLTTSCGFSGSGNKLYFTKSADAGNGYTRNALLQYSLDSPNIAASQKVIYDSSVAWPNYYFSLGDVTLAPNNKMYISVKKREHISIYAE